MAVALADAALPDGLRIYAIGDVHGYAHLLKAMHARINADLLESPTADWRIVHIGDYVDRGPDSKGVIDFLMARMKDEPRITALRGNHDQGMLDFLAVPIPSGLFADNGGEKTSASYGVELDFSSRGAFDRSARVFCDAVPDSHRAFMNALPASRSFGDYFFCHAGIEPGVPLDRQTPETLMWIRDTFLRHAGLYEQVVVHGHTPQPEVDFRDNRINIDTGVFLRGKLSALRLEGREKQVMTVRE